MNMPRTLICLVTLVVLLASGGLFRPAAIAAVQTDTVAEAVFTVGMCPDGIDTANLGPDPSDDAPLCDGDQTKLPVPAPGVMVSLRGLNSDLVLTAPSGVDGRVFFSGLPGGIYTATFDGDRSAAAICSTETASGDDRPVVNIAEADVPLEGGDVLACTVAIGGAAASESALNLDPVTVPTDLPFLRGGSVGEATPDTEVSPSSVETGTTDGPPQPGFPRDEAQGNTAEIYVVVGACPEGMPVADVGADPEYDGPLCADPAVETTPLGGVTVANEHQGGAGTWSGATDDLYGMDNTSALPLAAYQTTFPDLDGAIVSRCVIDTPDDAEADRLDIAAEPADLTVAGSRLFCRVGVALAPAETTLAPEPVDVLLRTYTCTPGDDDALSERLMTTAANAAALAGDGLRREELYEVCTDPTEAVAYTLTPIVTDEPSSVLSMDVVVEAEPVDDDVLPGWTAVPAGEVTIQADLPEDYGEPIVVCAYVSVVDGFRTSFTQSGSAANTFGAVDATVAIDLTDWQTVTCEWFNLDLRSE